VTATQVTTSAILRAEDITKRFGGLVAVDNVSFEVPTRSIVSIIGPNGAGKTTFFNMLTGLIRPTEGRILLEERNVTRSRPDVITARGVARTFQNIRLFGSMTATENVMIGHHARMRAGVFGAVFRPPWVTHEERRAREKARELLAYVGLKPASFDRLATQLPYGDQRRVEIARALASQPKLLLLDEPTAGVDAKARRDFWDQIHDLASEGLTVLVSTHYMDEAERCKRVVYLANGHLVVQGDAEEVTRRAGIITFEATGPNVDRAAQRLRATPGVDAAAVFGRALHVASTDRAALERAIASEAGHGLSWREVEPRLEDVFIHLLSAQGEPS
jgi:ABC-type branched-subunit amino acid transport system ATPase component